MYDDISMSCFLLGLPFSSPLKYLHEKLNVFSVEVLLGKKDWNFCRRDGSRLQRKL